MTGRRTGDRESDVLTTPPPSHRKICTHRQWKTTKSLTVKQMQTRFCAGIFYNFTNSTSQRCRRVRTTISTLQNAGLLTIPPSSLLLALRILLYDFHWDISTAWKRTDGKCATLQCGNAIQQFHSYTVLSALLLKQYFCAVFLYVQSIPSIGNSNFYFEAIVQWVWRTTFPESWSTMQTLCTDFDCTNDKN